MSLRENFVDRHIGPDQVEIQRMLDELGEDSLQSLIAKVVPENIVINQKLVDLLPQGISDVAAIERLKLTRTLRLASRWSNIWRSACSPVSAVAGVVTGRRAVGAVPLRSHYLWPGRFGGSLDSI